MKNDYEQPKCTIDVVLFRLYQEKLNVFLLRRGSENGEPFPRSLALPGGYVHTQEDINVDATAKRVIEQKICNVDSIYLEQLRTFSGSTRDPRGWSMSLAYCALMSTEESMKITHGIWVDVDKALGLDLAFDHKEILSSALNRVRNKTNYSSLPANLLKKEFTLQELKSAYENVLKIKLDKSTFRSRIMALGAFEAIEGKMRLGHQRPAQLYKIKENDESLFLRSNLR